MKRDIDTILEQLQALFPNLKSSQIKKTHLGDDDGLWFLNAPEFPGEIQLESWTGNCPFIIEAAFTTKCIQAPSVGQAIDDILALLREHQHSHQKMP